MASEIERWKDEHYRRPTLKDSVYPIINFIFLIVGLLLLLTGAFVSPLLFLIGAGLTVLSLLILLILL